MDESLRFTENKVNGDEVTVVGRLKTEQWEDRETKQKRSGVSLLVDAIGPNLRFATAALRKVSRDGGPGGGSLQGSPDLRVSAPSGYDRPPF